VKVVPAAVVVEAPLSSKASDTVIKGKKHSSRHSSKGIRSTISSIADAKQKSAEQLKQSLVTTKVIEPVVAALDNRSSLGFVTEDKNGSPIFCEFDIDGNPNFNKCSP
jgi:hypothetical protein